MCKPYVSEHTIFMRDYLAKHPEVVADQLRGRKIYWDRPATPGLELEAATTAQPQAIADARTTDQA
ncbi:MAG: DUF3460 family protein [Pseudomonadota bacterium]